MSEQGQEIVKVCAPQVPEKNETEKSKHLTPHILTPITTVKEALDAWHQYQSLKTELADEGDFVKIRDKSFPTKQFANKLSKFFGLSVSIVKAEKEEFPAESNKKAYFVWHIWSRAEAPNGQFRDGDGHCASNERSFAHVDHDVYATAVTRSKGRAIMELAGFGEVTSDEIQDDEGRSCVADTKAQAQGVDRTTAPSYPKATIILSDGTRKEVGRYEALPYFNALKKAIGDEKYYEILSMFKLNHANDAQIADIPNIYATLLTCWKQGVKK